MASRKEINEYYSNLYNKDFPSATLTNWVNKGKIRYTILPNGRYDYNLEDFISLINSPQYLAKLNAKKEKPADYIGKIKGHLYIKAIVPKEEKHSQYNGTLMYCDCLLCGRKNIQVRFTYLSDSGNYDQLTCGCGRKIRAFLSSARQRTDHTLELLHGQILSLLGGDAYGAVLTRPSLSNFGRSSSRSHCPPLVGLNEFAPQNIGF